MAQIGEGMRFALVLNPSATGSVVKAYMPANYDASTLYDGTIIISGRDLAGWTLDGYVLPRLLSGMIAAVELTPVREV